MMINSNEILNLVERLPGILKQKIYFYEWKSKTRELNQEYNLIFHDLHDNGTIFVNDNFLKIPVRKFGNHCGLLMFNFRDLRHPNYWKGISRLIKISDKYDYVNDDYFTFEDGVVKEYVKYPLPKKYIFTSEMTYLQGYSQCNDTQDIYNLNEYYESDSE